MRVFILFYALFLSLFLSTIVVAGEGFVAGTLVRIPTGYTCIQDLYATDEVLVYTFDDNVASGAITTITSHEVDTIVRLEVEGDTFELAHDQLLFAPLQRKWLPASKIQEGMYLLGSPLRAVQVQSVRKIDQCTQVYALTLNEHHNYLVGKHGIVVHNFGPMVFGAVGAAEGLTFLNVFLAANPLVAPVAIAVGGAGLIGGFIWKAIGEIKESKKPASNKSGNSGGGSGGKGGGKGPGSSGAVIGAAKIISDNKDQSGFVWDKVQYVWDKVGRITDAVYTRAGNIVERTSRVTADMIEHFTNWRKLDGIKENLVKISDTVYEIKGKIPGLPGWARYIEADKLHKGEIEVYKNKTVHMGAWVIDKGTNALRWIKPGDVERVLSFKK